MVDYFLEASVHNKEIIIKLEMKHEESFGSYLYRNLQRNYYYSIKGLIGSKVYFHLNSNLNYYKKELEIFRILNDSLKLENSEMKLLTLNRFDEHFNEEDSFSSQSRVYYQTKVKFCPCCLKEDYFHRLFWDISYVTACLKHNVSLLEKCNECTKEITMKELMEGACSCGKRIIVGQKVAVTKEVVSTQEKVQKLILGGSVTTNDCSIIQGEIYFKLTHLICLLVDGLNLNNFMDEESMKDEVYLNYNVLNKGKKEIENINRINDISFKIMMSYDYYFPLLIKEVKLLSSQDIRKNKKKILWKFINLGERTRLKGIDLIRDNMDDIIPIDKSNLINVNLARKDLMMGYENFINMLDQIGITRVVETIYGKKILYIHRDDFLFLLKTKKALLTTKQASDILGIKSFVLRNLVEQKIVPAIKYKSMYYFKTNDIKGILDNIKGFKIDVGKTDWVHYKKYNKQLGIINVSFGDLIKLIQKGIISAGINTLTFRNKKLRNLFLLKKDVEDYIYKQKSLQKDKRLESYGYSVTEIRDLIGVRHEKVKELIRDGELKITAEVKVNNGRLYRYIDKNELKRFLEKKK